MPPEETKERIRQDPDTLTPERAEEVASAIAEQWSRDWGIVLEKVVEKTGLSRSDAYQFMLLREMAIVGTHLQRVTTPVAHPDCAACRDEKKFHELQQEALELTIKNLKEEHGEDWQG